MKIISDYFNSNNKQMKYFVIIASILLTYTPTQSQGNARANTPSFTNQASQSGLNGLNRAMRTLSIMNAQYKYRAISETYDEVDGSPYCFEDFNLATLVNVDGSQILNVPIKIDQYVEEIIAQDDKKEELVLDTRFYKEIFFEKEKENYSFKKVNPKHPDKFYQVIYESDNIVLFKNQEINLRKGENNGIAQTNSIFKKQIKYYIVKDHKLTKVNVRKKSLFSHFPIKEATAIRNFKKRKNDILSKEKDNLKLFALIMKEKKDARKINRP